MSNLKSPVSNLTSKRKPTVCHVGLLSPVSGLKSPVSNLTSNRKPTVFHVDLRSPVSNLRSPVSNLRSPVSNLRSPVSLLHLLIQSLLRFGGGGFHDIGHVAIWLDEHGFQCGAQGRVGGLSPEGGEGVGARLDVGQFLSLIHISEPTRPD